MIIQSRYLMTSKMALTTEIQWKLVLLEKTRMHDESCLSSNTRFLETQILLEEKFASSSSEYLLGRRDSHLILQLLLHLFDSGRRFYHQGHCLHSWTCKYLYEDLELRILLLLSCFFIISSSILFNSFNCFSCLFRVISSTLYKREFLLQLISLPTKLSQLLVIPF